MSGSRSSPPPCVDVLVATYNSAESLARALASARTFLPVHRLIVIDRHSTDGTQQIAARFGAEVHPESMGLGLARNLALRLADTDPVLFLDSDVVIVRRDFYSRAWEEYQKARTVAVVGMSVGHSFRYGLPLGLTLLGRTWALGARIPDTAQGRETYYLQRAVRSGGLRVRYVPEAMYHYGTYRAAPHWAEFQGAAIRASSGWNPRELLYSFLVVLLMHMNSRRPRNVVYTPLFYLKLLRGFFSPARWSRLDRTRVTPPPSSVSARDLRR